MKAKSIAVLGLQWGDEGKGKVIDYLSDQCDAVARFGGGANAGHTIVVEGQKFILKLLPSGVLRENKLCFIGAGVACDPEVLKKEMEELESRGIGTKGRIFIDFGAHLVLSLHKISDSYRDAGRGKGAIDTTKRGIGPAYADKASRLGVRVADIFDKESLATKLGYMIDAHRNNLGDRSDDQSVVDPQRLAESLCAYQPMFSELVSDVGSRIMELIKEGKKVLFEGAQGTLLDLDYGTYPYVTSSHTTTGGIFTGLGIPPSSLGSTVGVFKAYMTRVGHGPFPSEISGEFADELRERGGEYGSVTGRPRRVGWLDLANLKRVIALNGIDKLAITKLDVLDGLDEIPVCESYEIDGKPVSSIPTNHPDFCRAKPVFTKLAGWKEPTAGKNSLDKLPVNARKYLDYISERTGIPIWLISTGFSRKDTILLND
ncbi:MAG: adenylosuccinate synthase [candidate division Zixibacteria bacterium]